jgi:uncharacterized protein YwqG
MSIEALISKVFRKLDRSLREPSIANLASGTPTADSIQSCLGGRFLGTPGEVWPVSNGRPMEALLQVRTSELPSIPWQLKDVALFTVFIDAYRLPSDLPAVNGENWLIRSYKSLDNLVPFPQEPNLLVRPSSIRWLRGDTEGPGWQEASALVDLSKLGRNRDAIDQFHERYKRLEVTKVGGWPSYVQSPPDGMSDFFVFQVSSHPQQNWSWGDGGNGYFYFMGAWFMHWDCA